jgi:hypothetical protein
VVTVLVLDGVVNGPGADGALSLMLNGSVAPQVGWLYPLALIGLIVGVWWRAGHRVPTWSARDS